MSQNQCNYSSDMKNILILRRQKQANTVCLHINLIHKFTYTYIYGIEPFVKNEKFSYSLSYSKLLADILITLIFSFLDEISTCMLPVSLEREESQQML